jgi:hypothetical protein
MELVGQTFIHAPHLKQDSSSNVYVLGTACGNGLYIALRLFNPSFHSSNAYDGQTSVHLPQLVHFSVST